MRKRRIRRNFSGNTQGLTAEDRKAMQAYRSNRTSRRYYEDLGVIDSTPANQLANKPKTEE